MYCMSALQLKAVQLSKHFNCNMILKSWKVSFELTLALHYLGFVTDMLARQTLLTDVYFNTDI